MTHPATTQPAQPSAGGFLGAVGSLFGNIARMANDPRTQRTAGHIYNAVHQWRELDYRKEQLSTSEKIAAMARGWAQQAGVWPGVGTPPIVVGGGSAPPAAPAAGAGPANTWIVPVAVLAAVVLLARRK